MTMILRVTAAEAVMARFNGRAFAWGEADCGRLAAAALREMGHKVSLAKGGRYSTALGAQRAIRRAGYASLTEALDARLLPRIAPAAALPADIVALPSDDGEWPALTVALGNGRVLGFRDRDGQGVCGVLQPSQWLCAWRVDPCPRPQ